MVLEQVANYQYDIISYTIRKLSQGLEKSLRNITWKR